MGRSVLGLGLGVDLDGGSCTDATKVSRLEVFLVMARGRTLTASVGNVCVTSRGIFPLMLMFFWWYGC